MPPAPSHRAWALARLAQIREVAEERQRWAEVQQRQLLAPTQGVDPAQVAREAEAARLADARLQERLQRYAATLAAVAGARARARAWRQAQAQAQAEAQAATVIEPSPLVVSPPARRWNRLKQRWELVEEAP
jgi:hypothetical protein